MNRKSNVNGVAHTPRRGFWRLPFVMTLVIALLASGLGAALAEDTSGIRSDDFSTGTLAAFWAFYPATAGTMGFQGAGSNDAWLTLSVPEGTEHNLWNNVNVPRIMQPANNTDFMVEAKFESPLELVYQMQGILVQQDDNNLLRFDFDMSPDGVRCFAMKMVAGYSSAAGEADIDSGTVPLYMRVSRVVDHWTMEYSYNGTDWTSGLTVDAALTVQSVGVFAGNISPDGGLTPAPAFTAQVDYFFNSATPIVLEDPLAQRALTTTASPLEGGTITRNPEGDTYEHGTEVTLTAEPAEGWDFVEWTDDASGTDLATTVTMDADKTVTANFAKKQYALTAIASPLEGGSITAEPDLATYEHGTDVTLTAVEQTGWKFTGWSGDLSTTDNPATITMDAAKSVTANFVREYALTTTPSPAEGGTINADPAGPVYEDGTVVTVTAVAAEGWEFTGWSGDLSTTDNPATITMDAAKSVTANFAKKQYTLVAVPSPLEGGTVTVEPQQGSYEHGTVVTVTAVAETGWEFSGWSGDASGTDNPVTITMDGNKSVTASFTEAGTPQVAYVALVPLTFNGR